LVSSSDGTKPKGTTIAPNVPVTIWFFMDQEGKAIATTTETGGVQDRVATHGETTHPEFKLGLEAIVQVDLCAVPHRSLAHVAVGSQSHDCAIIICVQEEVGILNSGQAKVAASIFVTSSTCVSAGVRAQKVGELKLGVNIQIVLGGTSLLWVPIITADTNVKE